MITKCLGVPKFPLITAFLCKIRLLYIPASFVLFSLHADLFLLCFLRCLVCCRRGILRPSSATRLTQHTVSGASLGPLSIGFNSVKTYDTSAQFTMWPSACGNAPLPSTPSTRSHLHSKTTIKIKYQMRSQLVTKRVQFALVRWVTG